MVEKVRITPSKITLKDDDGIIKFDTSYDYIKTGSGTLYAGGYDRAPAIYGQNTVIDHTNGGLYTSGLLGGTLAATTDTYIWTPVPKAVSLEFRNLPNGGTLINPRFISPTSKFVKYYNYDTKVRRNTSYTFYWQMEQYAYGVDSDGNYTSTQWEASPVLSSNDIVGDVNINGGTFEFDYTANEYKNWYRTLSGYDPESGQYYEITQYGRDFYAERTAYDGETGQPYTIPGATIYIKRCGIFSTRSPTALSLAVTP